MDAHGPRAAQSGDQHPKNVGDAYSPAIGFGGIEMERERFAALSRACGLGTSRPGRRSGTAILTFRPRVVCCSYLRQLSIQRAAARDRMRAMAGLAHPAEPSLRLTGGEGCASPHAANYDFSHRRVRDLGTAKDGLGWMRMRGAQRRVAIRIQMTARGDPSGRDLATARRVTSQERAIPLGAFTQRLAAYRRVTGGRSL
jgi:hypothetical protein